MFDIGTVFFAVVGIPILILVLLHVVNFLYTSRTAPPWQTAPGTIEGYRWPNILTPFRKFQRWNTKLSTPKAKKN